MAWGTNVNSLPDFYIDGETLKVLQDFLFSGFHILLTGNPGCGKTFFGQAWGRAVGLNVHKVNCGAIRNPREWFGRWEYREGHGTEFVPSKFAGMIEQPALILLDEINRTTPDNHNPILNILDGNREVYVEELNRSLKVHDQTLFIATANQGKPHTGIFPMDAALSDRFQAIRLTLPPQEIITSLLGERYPIANREASTIARITAKLNEMYDQDLLSVSMGMRPALAAASLIVRGNSLATALKYAFVNHYPADGIDNEQTLVAQTMQGLVD